MLLLDSVNSTDNCRKPHQKAENEKKPMTLLIATNLHLVVNPMTKWSLKTGFLKMILPLEVYSELNLLLCSTSHHACPL